MALIKTVHQSDLGSYMDFGGIEPNKLNPVLPAVNPTPIGFIPTATGNATNRNEFVIDSNGRQWFIDYAGDAIVVRDPTSTITVDRTFAEGVVVNTGTNFNVGTNVTTPYIFGSTLTFAGAGNDNRLYQVTFASAHPDGTDYIPTVSGISNEPNGDEAKVNVVEGSITANGFQVITTLDDNGGTEDPQVFLNFTYRVVEKVTITVITP